MRKVLVVDDSKTIRTLCEWIYKGLEDKVLTADSASSARTMISSESPDVVVVDYTLPDSDAYEFVSSICDKVHVVMMGGTYAPFDESKALSSGAAAVITKPFKSASFFEAVDKAAAAALGKAAAPISAATEASTPAEAQPSIPSPLHPSSSEGVPSIASFASAPSVAPIGSHVAPSASSPSSPGIGSIPRRFNFPTSPASAPVHPEPAAPAPEEPKMNSPFSASHADSDSFQHPAETATPRTPVPSVPPAAAPEEVKIDQAMLRAEVIAAVKSMLPAIVNSYLKKLIQAEVKPQLQNWVDSRVEALVKKMTQPKE